MAEQSKAPILVVDDEPEILFSLRALLRREFEVSTAESGAEAMEVLQQQPIHVVMTDQRMPAMTGVELLRQVQGECPDAIRMIFTGYSDIKAVIDSINEGHVFRYILKPWDPEELRAVLHQACEEHDRIIERRRLLADLSEAQSRAVTLVTGLQDGRLGTLNPSGQAEVEQLAATGRSLVERVREALSPGAAEALDRREGERG